MSVDDLMREHRELVNKLAWMNVKSDKRDMYEKRIKEIEQILSPRSQKNHTPSTIYLTIIYLALEWQIRGVEGIYTMNLRQGIANDIWRRIKQKEINAKKGGST